MECTVGQVFFFFFCGALVSIKNLMIEIIRRRRGCDVLMKVETGGGGGGVV